VLAGDVDGLAGDDSRGQSWRGQHTTVLASREQTLSGRGARFYTAHRGWLGVVTGISAASIGGVLVIYDLHEFIHGQCFDKVSAN